MENIKLTQIKELIINTEKSKIYKSALLTDMYNKIFNKNEKPTNCGSCLRTFFLKIKNWYQDELKKQMETETERIITDEDEIIIDSPVNEIIEDKIEVEEQLPDNSENFDKPREEITIINKAIRSGLIEADGEESKLPNEELVELIEQKSKGRKKKS